MIRTENINVGYQDKVIINNLNIEFNKGEITSIVGPNGSGKSTFLNSLTRNLKINSGNIYYENNNIVNEKVKALSQKISVLSQFNEVNIDITVEELIYYGRIPHKKWYEVKTKEDEQIVEWAMMHTDVFQYAKKSLLSLSGGERQRVFIAMTLAQSPKFLILDEPTTYLDVSHQISLMKLVTEINKKLGITVAMVLHDLNHAARYSDRIVMMKEGSVFADGAPVDVITEKNLNIVYNITSKVFYDINDGFPFVVPIDVFSNAEMSTTKIKYA